VEIYLDTAHLPDIERFLDFIDGVTTNPTLVARETGDMAGHVRKVLTLVAPRPVMAEVIAEEAMEMVEEARQLARLGEGIIVKVPATLEGFRAARALSEQGIRVTVTLSFSALQVLMAARAGAFAVAVFVGRLEDGGEDGVKVVAQSRALLDEGKLRTRLVAASIRHGDHIYRCVEAGADIVTVPAKIMEALAQHPLTGAGLAQFRSDWRAARERSAEASHRGGGG
jgi:transaldolase